MRKRKNKGGGSFVEEILRLEGIEKSYGHLKALDGISLSVKEGEFVSLLGPSGCGKTTLLRIIAGLARQDKGRVILGGTDITKLPPEKRDVNTIFQSYALFPHMTVEENIGYGLKIQGVKKKEIKEQVAEMLRLVSLEGCEGKYPAQLSGGQKQRVAIARGLIKNPRVLLLDEPLGALDLQLRRYLTEEIRRIQQETGTTFIYITHDRDEAMNMSDRMIIMNEGKFVCGGTPREIYKNPKTRFTASFIGLSNIFTALGLGDKKVMIGGEIVSVPFETKEGDSISLCLRTEDVAVGTVSTPGSIKGQVTGKSYSGGIVVLSCILSDGTKLVGTSIDKSLDISTGDTVFVTPDMESASVLED